MSLENALYMRGIKAIHFASDGSRLMLAAQCQVARAILKWSAADLAKQADMSPDAIARFEDGAILDESIAIKLQSIFETSGVEFTFDKRPGVRVRTLDGIIEVSAGHLPDPARHEG